MNYFERLIDDLNASDTDYIAEKLQPLQEIQRNLSLYFARVNAVITEYQKTGDIPDLTCIDDWEKCEETPEVDKKSLQQEKENVKPVETKKEDDEEDASHSPPRTRRTRRNNAPKENNDQDAAPRTRRTTRKKTEALESLKIKTEKLSLVSENTENIEIPDSVIVKTEMPAPSKPAPKRKKKKESKIQIKQEKKEVEDEVRYSDVVIQEQTVTTVNLVESSDEGDTTISNNNEQKSKRAKRSRTSSSESESNKNKKRSKSNDEEKNTAADATFVAEKQAADATFVAQKSEATLNTTLVVENPKMEKYLLPKTVEDMMTDDESEDEKTKKKKSPMKPIRAIPKPTKPVFSPFAQSPVKQKVKAFEKLCEETTAPRITRTKTRALAKENQEEENVEESATKSNVKEKAKMFTPAVSKFLPKAASTTIKPSRPTPSSSSNESLLSAKSASALKASQAEFREREKRRKEKELDAIKKREAMIQAQIEEKKRKREEKQLKAQQQRELLEKDKMKVLEAQRLKDERHKKLIAEQEEKKLKLKEEMEKKRMLAKQRAIEEKKREEEKRREEQKKQEEMTAKLAKQDSEMVQMLKKQKQKQIPIYLRTKEPLLPTDDCYDSDDEDNKNNRYSPPSWCRDNGSRFAQRCMFAAGEVIKNTFFSIQAQTPDLQEIFEVIEPQKLKRSSSAVWHKPPRFTMMPELEKYDETEECDEVFYE